MTPDRPAAPERSQGEWRPSHLRSRQQFDGGVLVRPIDVGAGDLVLRSVRIGAHLVDLEVIGRGETRAATVRCRGEIVAADALGEAGLAVTWDPQVCEHAGSA